MSQYYNAKVSIKYEDDVTGRVKSKTELYLVDGMSVTEVEAKMYKKFEDYPNDWEVISVVQTKVVAVVDDTHS